MPQNPTRKETTTLTVIKQTSAFLLASTRIWDTAHMLVPIDGADAGKHFLGNDADVFADLVAIEDGGSGSGATVGYVDDAVAAEALARSTADTNLNNGLQGVQVVAGANTEAIATETAARIAADAGKADASAVPKLFVDESPQNGARVCTGNADADGQLIVDLATAHAAFPGFTAVTFCGGFATAVGSTYAAGRPTDLVLATYTVKFFDIEGAATVAPGTPVGFLVIGTLA